MFLISYLFLFCKCVAQGISACSKERLSGLNNPAGADPDKGLGSTGRVNAGDGNEFVFF